MVIMNTVKTNLSRTWTLSGIRLNYPSLDINDLFGVKMTKWPQNRFLVYNSHRKSLANERMNFRSMKLSFTISCALFTVYCLTWQISRKQWLNSLISLAVDDGVNKKIPAKEGGQRPTRENDSIFRVWRAGKSCFESTSKTNIIMGTWVLINALKMIPSWNQAGPACSTRWLESLPSNWKNAEAVRFLNVFSVWYSFHQRCSCK